MKVRFLLLVLGVAMVAGGHGVAAAPAAAERHCVTALVPLEDTSTGSIDAALSNLGCYPTYREAVEVGTSGGTKLPEGSSPSTLTDRVLASSSTPSGSSVLIGTEYIETNFTLNSRSYFAPATCSPGVTWEVSYVTDEWNDDFESGKGFGGCDANKKFKASNFGGEVLTCTPHCANYGTLKNEVSSLRWRP